MFGIKYWPLKRRRTRLSIPLGLRHFGWNIKENRFLISFLSPFNWLHKKCKRKNRKLINLKRKFEFTSLENTKKISFGLYECLLHRLCFFLLYAIAIALTESLAYRSDWWRMNFFVRFFTIFGLYAGRIVILIPKLMLKNKKFSYSANQTWSLCTVCSFSMAIYVYNINKFYKFLKSLKIIYYP